MRADEVIKYYNNALQNFQVNPQIMQDFFSDAKAFPVCITESSLNDMRSGRISIPHGFEETRKGILMAIPTDTGNVIVPNPQGRFNQHNFGTIQSLFTDTGKDFTLETAQNGKFQLNKVVSCGTDLSNVSINTDSINNIPSSIQSIAEPSKPSSVDNVTAKSTTPNPQPPHTVDKQDINNNIESAPTPDRTEDFSLSQPSGDNINETINTGGSSNSNEIPDSTPDNTTIGTNDNNVTNDVNVTGNWVSRLSTGQQRLLGGVEIGASAGLGVWANNQRIAINQELDQKLEQGQKLDFGDRTKQIGSIGLIALAGVGVVDGAIRLTGNDGISHAAKVLMSAGSSAISR
jgi:hypothetical protein